METTLKTDRSGASGDEYKHRRLKMQKVPHICPLIANTHQMIYKCLTLLQHVSQICDCKSIMSKLNSLAHVVPDFEGLQP